MNFKDLNIVEPILKALEDKGYETPTPIQEKTIPLILDRKDVLGCAQTGTGKTAAFAIPIIQLIHQIDKDNTHKPKLRSLIVTPTRELAIQIDENIKSYSKHTKITHTVIFGGVKQGAQVDKLRKGCNILVATPGRLLDLISQGHISLDHIKLFVLDEADRMLDMGFINDIRKLLELLPEKRQSLFFSATMPPNIVKLSDKILTSPSKVEVTPASSTAETIAQHVYYTNRTDKKKLLLHLLKEKINEQVLIFTRTKHGADRVARDLKRADITAFSIHGDKAQNQRQKALTKFKAGEIKVLVATDIAARGIDIDKLRYVINYEIPNVPETYVHRIGRSGRAGEEGIAISICEPEENAYVKDIQKLTKIKLQVEDSPFPQTDKPMTPAEKKEWEKEKQRRKQEFFANRKANRGGGQGRGQGKKGGRNQKSDKRNGPKSDNSGKPRRDKRSDDRNTNDSNKQHSDKKGGEYKGNGKVKQKGTSIKGMPKKLGQKFRWPTLD